MIYPDRLAVASIRDWMNGTTVTVDADQNVVAFKKDTFPLSNETKYKTVNIYSFSFETWKLIVERLSQHIENGQVQGYYETVFSELVDEGALDLKAVSFDKKAWYEIDTVGDLGEAVKLFPGLTSIDLERDSIDCEVA